MRAFRPDPMPSIPTTPLPEFVGRWQIAGEPRFAFRRLAVIAARRLRAAALAFARPDFVHVPMSPPAAPCPVDRIVLPMSSGVNILPNASAQITSRPQNMAFRPERIVIGGEPGHWIVNEIRVGRRSQFAEAGDVPGAAFATEAQNADVCLDVVNTGANFTMVVTYVGPDPDGAPFVCSAQGTAGIGAEEAANPSRIYLPLSSGTRILPNTSLEITSRPQDPFRPERIIIGGDPNEWIVNEIKVGSRSQLSQSGDIPGVAFAATAMGTVSLETVQIAMAFTLVATYVGKNSEGEPFLACAIGSVPV